MPADSISTLFIYTVKDEKGVLNVDLFDVDAIERAESEIDRFILKRSRFQEAANREEQAWKESTRRVNVSRRRETRAAYAKRTHWTPRSGANATR